MVFNHFKWHIKNDQLSVGITAFSIFVHQWHMPLFFFVSGVATWYALGFRRSGQYIVERIKRLLIPLACGMLLIVPPQVYAERVFSLLYHDSHLISPISYEGTYLQFYFNLFNGLYPEGNVSWHHLWFLCYLFSFSLIALPFFQFLRRESGKRVTLWLGNFFEKRGMIFLFGIPLVFIEAVLRARWPGFQNLYDDWANFFFYLIIFIYGYLLCSDARYKEVIVLHGKSAITLAGIATLILLGLHGAEKIPASDYSLGWILYMVLRSFNTWFWIIAILSLGYHYLSFNNKVLQYANEAVLPFYILHQTIIVIISFYVVRWDASVRGKYFFISTVSLISTIVVYDLLIKRTHLTRFLLGMRLKRRVPE